MKGIEAIRGRTGEAAVPHGVRRGPVRRAVATSVAGLLVAMAGLAVAAPPASADGAYDPAADV
ncbi:MAG TPA: hypothetical protein VNN79_15905, partial [Actinomycetota bacterium]|nr:hypothetical protein [Actinomycetota bacterium]